MVEMEKLLKVFRRKLKGVEALPFTRFLMPDLEESVRRGKLTLLKGIRGTGKTTLLLQLARRMLGKVMYISMDHPYMYLQSLYDTLEKACERYPYVFIDEVHTYAGWERELKAAHDDFDCHILATGSSAMSLAEGKVDLSRRALLLDLPPLSLREYSIMKGEGGKKISWKDLLRGKGLVDLPFVEIEEYFAQALPFFKEHRYQNRVVALVERMVEKDLPAVGFRGESLLKAKRLLWHIATSPVGEVNISSLSSRVGCSKGLVEEILTAFERMGLLFSIPPYGRSGLRKRRKYYLVPPFRMVLSDYLGMGWRIGDLREEFFVHHVARIKEVRYLLGESEADFVVDGIVFEIGGRTKARRQLKGRQGFVVKDTPLPEEGALPLYAFGYLW